MARTVREGWVIHLMEDGDPVRDLDTAWDDSGEWRSPTNPESAFLGSAGVLCWFSTEEAALAFGRAEFDYQMGPCWAVKHVRIIISEI